MVASAGLVGRVRGGKGALVVPPMTSGVGLPALRIRACTTAATGAPVQLPSVPRNTWRATPDSTIHRRAAPGCSAAGSFAPCRRRR